MPRVGEIIEYPPAEAPEIRVGAAGTSATFRKIIEVTFTTSGSYTWKRSAGLPALMCIEMVYHDGQEHANTFDLNYVRSGITRDLYEYTASNMRTLHWYVPRDNYFRENDRWEWSNTAGGRCTLTIYAKYND